MKRAVVLWSILTGFLVLIAVPVLAAGPAGMKLYVFTSGSLGGFPKSAMQVGAEGTIDWAPVGFYVILHPKGNVIFDTGNNDKTITDPEGWWGPVAKAFGLKMTQNDAMAAQLAKIGLKTSDIKYVVLGHMHLDHAGNMSQFPNATFVIQNDELKAAWWPDPGFEFAYVQGDFADSKKYNIIRLNGDLDLFGDKSFEIIRAVGHTPGSQFAVVRLPKTGSIVLTSDVVFLLENLDKNLLPQTTLAWSPMGMLESYQKIRLIRDLEGARVFTAHDPGVFKATKQAPEFYE